MARYGLRSQESQGGEVTRRAVVIGFPGSGGAKTDLQTGRASGFWLAPGVMRRVHAKRIRRFVILCVPEAARD